MSDKSLVVIVPAPLRELAIGFAAAIGYTITFDFPLSADGGATVTHYALHAGAGPVMRLVLANEGSDDPEVQAEAADAFAALTAAGVSVAAVEALRLALLASVRGPGDAYGLAHLAEVCAANGMVFATG